MAYTTKIYFFTVMEAGKFYIKVLLIRLLMMSHFLALQIAAFLLCLHMAERRTVSFLETLLVKTLIKLGQDLNPMTFIILITSLQALSPNTVLLRVEASTCEFGEAQFSPQQSVYLSVSLSILLFLSQSLSHKILFLIFVQIFIFLTMSFSKTGF